MLRETVGTDVGALLAIESGRPTTADELLDLCRGPLLDGFRTGAAPFDAWIEQRRARLATAATRALIGARVSGRRSGRDADRAAAIDAALAALGPVPLAPTPGAPPLRVRAARPGRLRWLRPAHIASGGAALIVAAVLGTYLAVPRFHHVVDSLVMREAASPARIAVHQFTTVNGTEKEADLAGGVTLGVNYALYAVTARELFVVTSPVRATDDTHDALMEVARELRVRYLISGAVEVLGPTVRVLAQCLDAETGAVVWRRQFEKPVSDAFRLQDEITLQILAGLEIDLSTAERNRLQYLDDTGNLYAWLAAANGVRHLIRVKRRDVETAEQYYRKALEHDPNYLSAMRGLAWVRFLKVRLGWAEDPQAAILEASDTLQAILRRRTEAGPDVAPEDGLTLSLQGAVMLLAGDYDNAVRSGERALELLPGSADVTAVLAHTLTYVGEHERALALIERAMELSPLHPPWYRWTRGRALRMAGRVEESVAELERDIDREDRAIVHLVELVASYSAAGMMSKARRIAGLIRAMDPHFSASIWLRHPPIRAPDRQSIEFEYLARAGL
ncbi:hypothetical protein M1105_00270 [Limibaculum sp. FT325]|uniref:tetratricopeptide repeat protein n=1 Tax=Thermohalobaculum sediminis TaxID=2939436 RepID=UPI0020BDF4A2|nr:tetratricopeptide repeat protein [Limibaculum sediminis]MCL5775430.1 hypothetical protein [Limibaculum sediminis]